MVQGSHTFYTIDIECAGRKGVFPDAQMDPIIQIANMVTVHGESQPFIRNVFTLKSCANIVGSDVYSFETEEELLMAWKDFFVKVVSELLFDDFRLIQMLLLVTMLVILIGHICWTVLER